MARGVTTEWEDIQVKLGNYVAKEKELTMDDYTYDAMEKAEKVDPLEEKKLDELDELEDDLDEEFLNEYRKKRIEEMKVQAMKPKFGKLNEIVKTEFIQQVTNAPIGVFVVLHLYQDSLELCHAMNMIFGELAKKFPFVKFLKIVADKCIENFPEKNCPGVIVYKDGKMFKQLIPFMDSLKGAVLNIITVEWVLALNGIVKTEIPEDPLTQKFKAKFIKKNQNVDLSDEEDDREYSNPKMFKLN